MSTARRILLAIVVGGLVAGCGLMPTPLVNGQLILMEVANQSARPATLVVAWPGDVQRVIGSVDPAIVPASTTMTVRFTVPPTGAWSIWANGGELMGDFDVKERRGNIPMGINIAPDGNQTWWCRAGCP